MRAFLSIAETMGPLAFLLALALWGLARLAERSPRRLRQAGAFVRERLRRPFGWHANPR